MMIYLFIFSSVFFFGLLGFCMKRKHLLLMLLILEFIVLFIFMVMYMFIGIFNYEFYFSMIYLTMSVCEGSLGLSILVSMIRSHGNDYFHTFNLLW